MSTTVSENIQKVLRVDASARVQGSVSRELADALIAKLEARNPGLSVTHRDLKDGLPFVTEQWIGANFTAEEERDPAQRAVLLTSDALVAELQAADALVIAAPIYNFGVPAALKAWIDMIARARVTFRYTENGPVGLLEGKKAYVIIASGGTPVDSEIDFATGYLRHILGFVGIHDVDVIAADKLMMDADGRLARARNQIAALEAPITDKVAA